MEQKKLFGSAKPFLAQKCCHNFSNIIAQWSRDWMWFIIRGLVVGGAINWIQTVSNFFLSKASRFWTFDIDNAHQTFNLSIFALPWRFIRSPLVVDLFESMILQVWILSCCQNHFLQLQQKRRMAILRGFYLSLNTSHLMRPAATFYRYMSRLPLWEAELLKHMEFSLDPFTVSINFSHGIQEVSNGSSVWPDNQNSFGWTFCADLGGQSARGMGPAQGSKANFYWAEEFGMVAILCFWGD